MKGPTRRHTARERWGLDLNPEPAAVTTVGRHQCPSEEHWVLRAMWASPPLGVLSTLSSGHRHTKALAVSKAFPKRRATSFLEFPGHLLGKAGGIKTLTTNPDPDEGHRSPEKLSEQPKVTQEWEDLNCRATSVLRPHRPPGLFVPTCRLCTSA